MGVRKKCISVKIAPAVHMQNNVKDRQNRTVRINRELTAMHQEVIENLESIQGALLRMNRSIQAEGTFGIMKTTGGTKELSEEE